MLVLLLLLLLAGPVSANAVGGGLCRLPSTAGVPVAREALPVLVLILACGCCCAGRRPAKYSSAKENETETMRREAACAG